MGVLDYIVIKDAAGGAGSEVTTLVVTADDTIQVWAAGYDADNNYVGDISVTWATTGSLDPTPAGPATSTVFTPTLAPTSGTITADDGSGHTDSTGTITVDLGAKSYVVITTNLGGPDAIAGSAFDVTLTVYDADGNVQTDFAGLHNVDWTVSGASDAPDSTTPTLPVDGA